MSAVSSIGKFKSTPETYGLLDLLIDGLKYLVNRVREAWANRSCSFAQHAEHSKAASLISKDFQMKDPLDNEALSQPQRRRQVIVTTTTATEGTFDRLRRENGTSIDDLLHRFTVFSQE